MALKYLKMNHSKMDQAEVRASIPTRSITWSTIFLVSSLTLLGDLFDYFCA